ncbi:MAG: FAD binding domain-containing protein, partial [Acidobacteriota bacterium]
MYRFECFTPGTVEEAISYLADHGEEARPIAGGTALLILMKTQILTPRRLVNLKPLRDLEFIRPDGDGFRVGAMTTYRVLERSEPLRSKLPLLTECIHHVATSRIRNVATLGGNICNAEAASDPPAALLALEAEVNIQGKTGKRNVPISEFFKDYYETACGADELVTEIRIPGMPPRSGSAYESFTGRSQEDKPVASCAAVLALSGKNGVVDGARLALGGVSPTPIRARAAE